MMEDVLKMFKEWQDRHNCSLCELVLYQDGSGTVHKDVLSDPDNYEFKFDSIEELKQKLEE